MGTKAFIIVLSTLLIAGCLRDDPLKLPYSGYAPSLLDDGWRISTPDSDQMDAALLDQAYRQFFSSNELTFAASMVVARHGKLVGEANCRSLLDQTRPNSIWSCTKSFTSMMAGLAFQDGLLDSLDDPIEKYLPEAIARHPQHKGITLRNLLTMRGGIDFNAELDGQTGQLLRELPDDCVDFVLSSSRIDTPGRVFHYNNGEPILMSAIIQRRAGKSLGEYAQERFFGRMGISNYKWDDYRDGVTPGSFGLWMTPRDLAKVGWMVCDSGRWEGRQIVPFEWLRQSGAYAPDSTSGSYGFYWWIDASHQCFYMAGHGGQYVFVVPAKQLVVVITAEAFTQGEFELKTPDVDALLQKVIGACR